MFMYRMQHAGSHYGASAPSPPSSAPPRLTALSCQTNEHGRKARGREKNRSKHKKKTRERERGEGVVMKEAERQADHKIAERI